MYTTKPSSRVEWNLIRMWASDAIRRLWYDPNVDVAAIMDPRGLAMPTPAGTSSLDEIAPRIAQILTELRISEDDTDQVKGMAHEDTENLCKAIVYSYHVHIADVVVKGITRMLDDGSYRPKPLMNCANRACIAITSGIIFALLATLSVYLLVFARDPADTATVCDTFCIIAILIGAVCAMVLPLVAMGGEGRAAEVRYDYEDHRNRAIQVSQRYKARALRALRGLSWEVRGRLHQTLKDDIQKKFGEDLDADSAGAISVLAVVDHTLADDSKTINSIQVRWKQFFGLARGKCTQKK